MKKLALAVMSLLIVVGSMAQKTYQDKNAVVRKVGSFHGIKVSHGIHLYLSQGNEEAVAVSASRQEYIERIKTEVENGVLKIYYDTENHDWSSNGKSLKAYVSCKTLDLLKASSGSEVDVDGTLKSGNLDLSFTSGANFQGKIESSNVKVDQNSGAEAAISGMATSLTIEGSSGATFKGYDLTTDKCDANMSSGATMRVTVNKELTASASSGGQIYYKGTGVIREISTSSGGEVSKR